MKTSLSLSLLALVTLFTEAHSAQPVPAPVPVAPALTYTSANYTLSSGNQTQTFSVPFNADGVGLPAIASTVPISIKGTYAPTDGIWTIQFTLYEYDASAGHTVGLPVSANATLNNGVWSVTVNNLAAGKAYKLRVGGLRNGTVIPPVTRFLNIAN